MAVTIVPYQPQHVAAVKDLNDRLRAAGAEPDLVFYEDPTPRHLSRQSGSTLYNEFFVAAEDGVVRAGYALKHQLFLFPDGEVRSLAYYHHPLSEGVVNKAYSTLGVLLLRDAIARQPLLYCLGMEGYHRPLPQMLKLLGWRDYLVPFFFRVIHPAAFLREVEVVRRGPWRQFLMNLAAWSGGGWMALKGLQRWNQWRAPKPPPSTVEEVPIFDMWADPLWERARRSYALTAVRDAETLRLLFPATETQFTRLRLLAQGKVIGWAVVAERRKSPRFGNLRVGSIVDCFAAPENAVPVVRAATQALERIGVDAVFSNQSHEVWRHAFRDSGFLQGPSSFIFAASRELSKVLSPWDKYRNRMHFTRADGDGLPRNY
jgi:hypothetical protein